MVHITKRRARADARIDYANEMVYEIHIDRHLGNNKHISSTPRHQQMPSWANVAAISMPANGI